MRCFVFITCVILGFYCKSFASNFFIGVSAVNLNNKYYYEKLKVRQYIGDFAGVQINQYIDLEFPRSSSFGTESVLGEISPGINLGYKFNLGNFYYTPELFAFYDFSKVQDLTVVPAQNFEGLVCILPNCKPPLGAIVQEIDIPAQIQSIKYSMPVNAGMISRMGYDFESVSVNIISGGTLTIFTVDDGTNKETIYKGRFIAGFGFEWKLNKSRNLTLFADYKYFIPISKDIEREYDDPANPGKKTKVAIEGFKASTQILEIGLKYYI